MGKFFASLALTAVALWLLTVKGASAGLFDRPTFLFQTLLFLTFGTGLVFAYLYRAGKPEQFVNLFLFTMIIKLVAYCVYNLVIIMYDRQGAVTNVGFFMASYFIFTSIEIGFLHRKITGENKP